MADTETTNYNFIKPEVGSSLWGAKLNTDMDSIDEEIKTVEDAVDTKAASSHTHTESDITDLDHTDSDAIHDNTANEISAVAAKTTITSLDLLLIEDSADSYDKKKIAFSVVASGIGASTAIHTDESEEIEGLDPITTPYYTDLVLLEDSSDTFSKAKIILGNTQSAKVIGVMSSNSWSNTSTLSTYFWNTSGDLSEYGIRENSVIHSKLLSKFELDSGTIALHVGGESLLISSLGSYQLDIDYNAYVYDDSGDTLREVTTISLYESSTMVQHVLTDEASTDLNGYFKFQFSAASADNSFTSLVGYCEILYAFEDYEEEEE